MSIPKEAIEHRSATIDLVHILRSLKERKNTQQTGNVLMTDYPDTEGPTYVARCTAKRWRVATLLGETTPIPPTPAEATYLALCFEYISSYVSDLAIQPDLHDLWSAIKFAQGYNYGETSSDNPHRSGYLKPLQRFKAPEIDYELLLAHQDMASFAQVLVAQCGSTELPTNRFPNTIPTREKLLAIVVFLMKNEQFMQSCCAAIHQNWLNANQPPQPIEFNQLPDDHQTSTLANCLADLGAVLLFLDDPNYFAPSANDSHTPKTSFAAFQAWAGNSSHSGNSPNRV